MDEIIKMLMDKFGLPESMARTYAQGLGGLKENNAMQKAQDELLRASAQVHAVTGMQMARQTNLDAIRQNLAAPAIEADRDAFEKEATREPGYSGKEILPEPIDIPPVIHSGSDPFNLAAYDNYSLTKPWVDGEAVRLGLQDPEGPERRKKSIFESNISTGYLENMVDKGIKYRDLGKK